MAAQEPVDPLLLWQRAQQQQQAALTHAQAQTAPGARVAVEEKPHKKVVPWTPEEDSNLLAIIDRQSGILCWSEIAKQLMTVRTGKQCRERYLNHLMPGINKAPFTSAEDALLLALYAEQGSRWRSFTQRLPGRSDNAIKNRFNALKHKWKHNEREREKKTLREMAKRKGALKSKKDKENKENKTKQTTSVAPSVLHTVSQSQSLSPSSSSSAYFMPSLSLSHSPSLSSSLPRSFSFDSDDNPHSLAHTNAHARVPVMPPQGRATHSKSFPSAAETATTRCVSIPEEDAMDVEEEEQRESESEGEKTEMDVTEGVREKLSLSDKHFVVPSDPRFLALPPSFSRDPLEALLSLPEEDWERLQSTLSLPTSVSISTTDRDKDTKDTKDKQQKVAKKAPLPLLSPIFSLHGNDRLQRLCGGERALDTLPDLITKEYPLALSPSLSSLSPRYTDEHSSSSAAVLSPWLPFSPLAAYATRGTGAETGTRAPPLLSAISPFTPFLTHGYGYGPFSPCLTLSAPVNHYNTNNNDKNNNNTGRFSPQLPTMRRQQSSSVPVSVPVSVPSPRLPVNRSGSDAVSETVTAPAAKKKRGAREVALTAGEQTAASTAVAKTRSKTRREKS